MLKNLYILAISLLPILVNANDSLPIAVKESLQLAGKNRSELQKVITHYKESGNLEKLESAYFLIKNMPDKYGVYYNEDLFYFDIFKEVDSLARTTSCEELIDNYISRQVSTHSNSGISYEKIFDINVITSEFLIDNIDLSYQAWKEKPWAQHLSFDEYCEWILPYRVMDEPLQPWRKAMLQELSKLVDSLKTPEDPKEICLAINKIIAKDFRFSSKYNAMPMLGGVDLWKTKTGICEHRYLLVTFAMRSMGVPVSIDFTNQFSYWPGSHEWTVLLDTDKKIKPFNGGETKVKFFVPANCPIWYEGITNVSTVYRRVYAKGQNKYLSYENIFLPQYLQKEFIENVSGQYDLTRRGDLSVSINKEGISDYAYLLCFSKGEDFIVVDCEKTTGDSVKFKGIGRGIYLVGYIENNSLMMDSNPFIWEPDSSITFLNPDISLFDTATICRKYPVQGKVNQYISELKGAEIQASKKPDFRKSETLYVISGSDNIFKKFNVKKSKKYRYYRIIPETNKGMHLAEAYLYFNNPNDSIEKLNGKPIGYIPDVESCDDGIIENAFDDNIRTNFNAPEGSWVGIDAGKTIELEAFRLIIRNHLNIIEPGDSYELFYFDMGWKSLGKQIASDYSLMYSNIPRGALLLLKNHTKGIEERIFTIENKTQAWK
jgi:hypothetical protein